MASIRSSISAANGDESPPWEELIAPNLDALSNVFHAAALAGVERVIFASSNHVMWVIIATWVTIRSRST